MEKKPAWVRSFVAPPILPTEHEADVRLVRESGNVATLAGVGAGSSRLPDSSSPGHGEGEICKKCICKSVAEERCSDSSQIIMRINDITNAHGEVWNGSGNYPVEICYDDIFGYEYTGENPHECNGENNITWLYDETNSLASNESGFVGYDLPLFNTPVCYGNLECKSQETDCQNPYKLVVSLSRDHLAFISKQNDYPVKICCKPATKKITNMYWTNMLNQQISEADLNDTVKLVIEGVELQGEITYEIIKKNAFLWIDLTSTTLSSDKAEATWKAGLKDDGSLSKGTYYFRATLENGETKTSGNLIVGDKENSPPHAEIVKPKIGEIYFKNEIIGFEQASYDEDDFFNYEWYLGDGNKIEGSSRDYSNYNITHSYSSGGQKNILLNITDERCLYDNDRTSILIIDGDGKYVFAHIAKPKWGENFIGRVVRFNATTSYAIEVSNGEITCIAGDCPDQTANGSSIDNSPQEIDNLNFYWEFDDGKTKNESGMDGAYFTKIFTIAGNHHAKLTVSINPSSDTETEFSNYFEKPSCIIDDEGRAFWVQGILIHLLLCMPPHMLRNRYTF